jgi:hypothetical protein
VVIELIEKFVQDRVPVSLRKWLQCLRCWPVFHDRFRLELFLLLWIKEFPLIESYVSGQDNLIELGDPNTIDIAGMVANEISNVCSWAKLELIDVFPGLIAAV